MKNIIIGIALAMAAQSSFGQANSFSLAQSVDYAIKNNIAVKNSTLDIEAADNRTRELRAKGLPQVDAGIDYQHNFKVQKIILENGVIAAFSDPSIPYGSVLAFQLQLNNVLTGSITASQIIYDKALLAGLDNAQTYHVLADKKVQRTKIDVAESVTKAYYGVLVAQKQLDFLNKNLTRLDSLFKEAGAKFKNGLVRKIDVDRIEVRYNNLKEEKEKASKIVDLSNALLHFQMNLDLKESLMLTDTLNESLLTNALAMADNGAHDQDRIEYSILKTQRELALAEGKVIKGNYAPRLSAFATSGYNPAATNLGDIFQSSRYYNYTYVGLRLSMPIFHGFEKKYKIQNKIIDDHKLENSLAYTAQSIRLENQQAGINLANNLESLKTQKRNLDLAQENVRIVRVENQKGIATNLEVTNAEADLKEAQTNYYNILYASLISKVDLDKAQGVLLTE